jgi:hypothetical protein
VVEHKLAGRVVAFRFSKAARYRIGLLPVAPTWEDFKAGGDKTVSAMVSFLWACQNEKPLVFAAPEELAEVIYDDSALIDQLTPVVLRLLGIDPESFKKKPDDLTSPSPSGSSPKSTSGSAASAT